MKEQDKEGIPQDNGAEKKPRRIKAFLNVFKQQAFITFLVLSMLLWFFNHLGNRFTTEIHMPVHIVTDYYSNVWVEQDELEVRCLVEGEGRRLMLYKFGLVGDLDVPASDLAFTRDYRSNNPYGNLIDRQTMLRALALGIKDINFLQVIDSLLTVNISPMKNARLPIRNNIRIEPDRQYMQVGPTLLTPDSINVKAPEMVLDSIKHVDTQSRNFIRARRALNGSVGLQFPSSMISEVSSVRYSADVTSYTEVEYTLEVEITSLPASIKPTMVPPTVDLLLKVPLRSYNWYQSKTPVAKIDYATKEDNLSSLFPVKIDSLPPGVEVISLNPEFVEAFFEKIKR